MHWQAHNECKKRGKKKSSKNEDAVKNGSMASALRGFKKRKKARRLYPIQEVEPSSPPRVSAPISTPRSTVRVPNES